MSAEEAQEEYMKILKLWSGFGTTLFSVTVSSSGNYNELCINVSNYLVPTIRPQISTKGSTLARCGV